MKKTIKAVLSLALILVVLFVGSVAVYARNTPPPPCTCGSTS